MARSRIPEMWDGRPVRSSWSPLSLTQIADPNMPLKPRKVAVARLMPPSWLIAAGVMALAGVVTHTQWPIWLGLAVLVYTLIEAAVVDHWSGEGCEPADHWRGEGEMPSEMADECAYCVYVPLRDLWRGRQDHGQTHGRGRDGER